jgi:FkbM family methyltransferase
LKHLVFSKQCDHDLDLVPFWYHYYKNIYRADLLVLTPVKTRLSEIQGVCRFYRERGIEVIPIELDIWDDALVWQKQLDILRPRVAALGEPFTAISADTDQFFQPLDTAVAAPDVVFRRCFIYSAAPPVLSELDSFTGGSELLYDLTAGFVNTLDNPRIGPTGHFCGLVPRTSLRLEMHFSFRGSAQFEEKVSHLAVAADGKPAAAHWKIWKQLADDSSGAGLTRLTSMMNDRAQAPDENSGLLKDFLLTAGGRASDSQRRYPCPFGSQVMRNTFRINSPGGESLRDLSYPMNELKLILQTLSSGCYDLPPGIVPNRVIDIGTHAGAFSAMIKALHPSASICCFEACPDMYALLCNNFSAHEKVRIDPRAVSDKNGEAPWYIDPFSVFYDSLENQPSHLHLPNPVPVLDSRELDCCFPGETVDVIKLSVNGNEDRILSRSAECLKNAHCLFVRYQTAEQRAAALSRLSDRRLVQERPVADGGVLAFCRS